MEAVGDPQFRPIAANVTLGFGIVLLIAKDLAFWKNSAADPPKKEVSMQRYKTALVLALTILMPSLAAADTCPLASSANVNGRFVSIVSTASGPGPHPIADFIGTGCTAAAFGPNPPAGCRGGLGSFSLASFFASWPGAASNTTANGCTFTCDAGGTGGTANVCQMRGGDGLPVELMEFSLDQ